jgi:hypothetical protein
MARTEYGQHAVEAAEKLIEDVFALGGVGYVALGSGQEIVMREATGMVSHTTSETNFYEELLVNPTLLKLAGQRAELDCGGLNYIAIGYGDFIQFIMPMRNGHISIGVSRKTAVGEFAARVRPLLERHSLAKPAPTNWLLASA